MDSINSRSCLGLEKEFEAYITQDVNIYEDCGFKDYLEPNEGFPEDVQPHLELAEMGTMVAAGTQRCFFNLCFIDEKKCDGLVGRDINPKVKAFGDFNTLLLRISKTVEEYRELSKQTQDENDFHERIAVIRDKMLSNDLPDAMRNFYGKHLYNFGTIFLNLPQDFKKSIPRLSWTKLETFDNVYKKCQYHEDNSQFLKLKKYAESGNLIFTIGSINDLNFLKNRTISIVDVSNIPDYHMLNFKAEGNFRPRIIWTLLNPPKTIYKSYVHKAVTPQEESELGELFYKIERCLAPGKGSWLEQLQIPHKKCTAEWMQNHIFNDEPDAFNANTGPIYSTETLILLREYIQKHVIEIPHFGFMLMDPYSLGLRKFNDATPERIREFCHTAPELKRYLPILVNSHLVLDLPIYLAFSQLEGWHEAFEEKFVSSSKLEFVLNRLQEKGLLETFTQAFGSDRLEALKLKIV